MKFSHICILSALAVSATACTVQVPNDPAPHNLADVKVMTDDQVIAEIKQLSPKWKAADQIDRSLREFLAKAGLTKENRCRVVQAILQNSIGIPDEGLWKNAVGLLKTENLSDRLTVQAIQSLVTVETTKSVVVSRAEQLYRLYEEKFTAEEKGAFLCRLGNAFISSEWNEDKFVECCSAVQKLDLPENKKKQLTDSLLSFYLKFHPDRAVECCKKYRLPLPNKGELLICRAEYAVSAKDRTAFNRVYQETESISDSLEKTDLQVKMLILLKDEALLKKTLERKDLSFRNRWDVLNALFTMKQPPDCQRREFYKVGSYETFKSYGLQLDAMISEKDEQKKAGAKTTVVSDNDRYRIYHNLARVAYAFGDFGFSEEITRKIPKDFFRNSIEIRAVQKIHRSDAKGAVEIYRKALDLRGVSPADKRTAAMMIYFLEGGNYEGFDKALAEQNLTSVDKMNGIRECARLFFRGKNFKRAEELEQYVMKNMLRAPETSKKYAVRWNSDAPRSASAWALTPDFQDWNILDTRYIPYFGYGQDAGTDAKYLLKDAPEFSLPSEYRIGSQVQCDETGVHIYLRCDDPHTDEIKSGKRFFGTIEGVFQPGDKHPYYWFMMENLPNSGTTHNVNWATASKHYRLAHDIMQKDATLTKYGVAAHLFIPWLAVWDKLPDQDNVWRYGIQVWGPGGSMSSSGLVHELHRATKLEFSLSADQLKALKHQVALMAFYHYKRIRDDAGGVIQTWNDPVLGDPEFYRSELEDLIAELDAAGVELTDPKSVADIDAIYEKHVPVWAEITYILAEKREKYIKDLLLK